MNEIIKTKEQIQNKWDTMLCRFYQHKLRFKESYYEIARFAIGKPFVGDRQELQVFVISLELKRFVEYVGYRPNLGSKAMNDFRYAINRHNKKFIDDCFRLGPLFVKLDIDSYKWKDLTHKRKALPDAGWSINAFNDQAAYLNKSAKSTNWTTVK